MASPGPLANRPLDKSDELPHNNVYHWAAVNLTQSVNGSPWSWSGVVIESQEVAADRWRNLVLTCAHGIRTVDPTPDSTAPPPVYVIRTVKGGFEHYEARLLTINHEFDLSVLAFDSPRALSAVAVAAPSQPAPSVGSTVTVVCRQVEDVGHFSRVTAVGQWVSAPYVFDVAGPYQAGRSGGPVYQAGTVRGIIRTATPDNQQAVGLTAIHSVLAVARAIEGAE